MVSFSTFAHFTNRYIRCTLIYGDNVLRRLKNDINQRIVHVYHVFDYSRNTVIYFVGHEIFFLLCQCVRSSVRVFVLTNLALTVEATSYQRYIVSRTLLFKTNDIVS